MRTVVCAWHIVCSHSMCRRWRCPCGCRRQNFPAPHRTPTRAGGTRFWNSRHTNGMVWTIRFARWPRCWWRGMRWLRTINRCARRCATCDAHAFAARFGRDAARAAATNALLRNDSCNSWRKNNVCLFEARFAALARPSLYLYLSSPHSQQRTATVTVRWVLRPATFPRAGTARRLLPHAHTHFLPHTGRTGGTVLPRRCHSTWLLHSLMA